jgi:uncharacterized protein (TIGR02646 family)
VRLIQKGKEPRRLLEYSKLEHATYEGMPTEAKIELRSALIRDQGGLCCYCMCRIHEDEVKERKQLEQHKESQVRIEHWKSQSEHADLQLSWPNLFAACHGNEGKDRADQHCDVRKGKLQMTLNPTVQKHIASLRYDTTGQLQSNDPILQKDLDEVLNLNHVSLRRNRKEAVQAMIDSLHRLEKKKTGGTPRPFPDMLLRSKLSRCNEFDSTGRLPPFAGALAYWLEKRLGLKQSA